MRLFWKTRARINAWRTAKRRRKSPAPKADPCLRYLRFAEGDTLCVSEGANPAVSVTTNQSPHVPPPAALAPLFRRFGSLNAEEFGALCKERIRPPDLQPGEVFDADVTRVFTEGRSVPVWWVGGVLLLLTVPAVAQIAPPPPDLFPAAVSCAATCTTATITTSGYAQVNVEATGTGSSLTFKVEGKQGNSTTWHTLPAVVPTTPGTFVTSMSANGFWVVPVAGYQSVRVNLTAITGGTETFAMTASVRTNLNVGQ